MSNDKLSYDDKTSRERILNELDTTFLVEAGAGSGKTTSLVGRMINMIRTGKVDIKQMAAITFTNKAASELRGRFRIELEKTIRSAQTNLERVNLAKALENINYCFIGTIHSFCGGLLRERPIEAQLDPNFIEMDDVQSKEFRDRCWDEYIEKLMISGKESLIEDLLKLQIDVEDLHKVYHRVSKYEDVEIFTKQVDRPDFTVIRDTLIPMLNEAQAYIPSVPPENDWDALQKSVKQAQQQLTFRNLEEDMDILALARLFDKAINVTQNRWTNKNMAKQFKEQFQDWQIKFLKPFMEAWTQYLHPQLIQFVQPAIQFSRLKRMESGALCFQDLLMKVTELLREHKEVRQYFSRRYSHLFVDEFQDTDPIQAEMMMLLTGDDPDEQNWKKLLPRAGSLFIVGDPKQSIYRFRRADISTYNFVKNRIQLCGDVLQLTKNFRSVQSIGQYVNYTFESKFTPSDQQSDHQASYVEMLTKQLNPKDKRVMHGIYTMTYPKVEYDRKNVIAELDSERVAKFIAWACTQNLKIQEKSGGSQNAIMRFAVPSDFMILLQNRQFIGLYSEMLEKYGVAADTSGSRAFYEEIRVLHLLAKCLNDLSDRIPLLAVLRGLLFGISDDALFHYKREAGSISIFPLPDPEVLSETARPVYGALFKLNQYNLWIRRLPAFTAFSQIINDLGLIPYASVNESGALRAGTIVKLLQLIQKDSSYAANWDSLTEYLGQLVQGEGMEGTSLFAGTGHAVRIMNLHKAKGLEAPVVIMACPCGDSDHDAEEHIDRLSDPAQSYFTISRPKDAYNKEIIAQPLGWTELAAKEREYMDAEADRLLYVATTRTKQLLIVSQYPSRAAIDPWSGLHNTLNKQPELDEVEMEPVKVELLHTVPDVQQERRTWNTWITKASKATYEKTSVTEQVKMGSEIQLHRSNEGRGIAFGSVVHRLIDALGKGLEEDQLELYAQVLATEEKLDRKWMPDVITTISNFIKSELWQRSLKSRQTHHEFSLMVIKKSAAGKEIINKGVIDFLFEEEDGWVLVDFKTDTFEAAHRQEFIDYYRPQVMAYAQEWEHLGYKVKEVGLYFLNRNEYVLLN
jgi:ATP-dependent helicase/nuclease subunit A